MLTIANSSPQIFEFPLNQKESSTVSQSSSTCTLDVRHAFLNGPGFVLHQVRLFFFLLELSPFEVLRCKNFERMMRTYS